MNDGLTATGLTTGATATGVAVGPTATGSGITGRPASMSTDWQPGGAVMGLHRAGVPPGIAVEVRGPVRVERLTVTGGEHGVVAGVVGRA